MTETITLLRVEAVNLAHSILDTDDLSTRRGGGYMLLEAVREVERNFAGRISRISIGASIGLFEVGQGFNAGDLIQDVRDFVGRHPLYQHATFVVDAVEQQIERPLPGETNEDAKARAFVAARERVAAAVHWQQMSSLSIATHWKAPERLPKPGVEGYAGPLDAGEAVCKTDEVRPAALPAWFPGEEVRPSSTSVWKRRFDEDSGGRTLRQRFYERELSVQVGADRETSEASEGSGSVPVEVAGAASSRETRFFTQHLQALSARSENTDVPKVLGDKIALFYADGNGFGSRQRKAGSIEKLKKWDEGIRAKRKEMLRGLLDAIGGEDRWLTDPDEKTGIRRIRFETLMWGGDELLFVVPAWCGLELAAEFFRRTADMRNPLDSDEVLTHACSIVFAKYKAPISRLERLARDLAEQVGKLHRKDENSLSWIVLESFDHAGGHFDSYLERRYPVEDRRPSWHALALSPQSLRSLCDLLPGLKSELPRSAIVRALEILVHDERLKQDEVPNQRRLLERSYAMVAEALDSDVAAGADARAAWCGFWKQLTGTDFPLAKPGAARPTFDLSAHAPAHVAGWTVLLELWDYVLR